LGLEPNTNATLRTGAIVVAVVLLATSFKL
jgi:hypothetical protein